MELMNKLEKVQAFVQKHQKVLFAIFMVTYCLFSVYNPVFAGSNDPNAAQATGASAVTSKFNSLLAIIQAIVQAIGGLVCLWGFFEVGMAMQSNEGSMQSAAFKRVGGGIIMIIAPALLSAVQ